MTILFDLDGTLTDSGEGIIKSSAMVLKKYGLPVPSFEEMRVFVGPPLHETFHKFGIPAEYCDDAVLLYRTRYNTIGKFENSPYPGIRELLQNLKAQGHRLFVATSKPEALSIEILEHFDLARYFEIISGATEDRSRVEKSDVIAYLLQQAGSVEDCIMVGDTVFDVVGAKAHGIATIGVAWGYGKVEDMKNAGAAAIAETPEDLEHLLNK